VEAPEAGVGRAAAEADLGEEKAAAQIREEAEAEVHEEAEATQPADFEIAEDVEEDVAEAGEGCEEVAEDVLQEAKEVNAGVEDLDAEQGSAAGVVSSLPREVLEDLDAEQAWAAGVVSSLPREVPPGADLQVPGPRPTSTALNLPGRLRPPPLPNVSEEVRSRASSAVPGSRCSSASRPPKAPEGFAGPAAAKAARDFRQLITKGQGAEGSLLGQAWLRHVDTKKRGVVKFRGFCRTLGVLGYEGDVMLLWHALHVSSLSPTGLTMDVVDAESAQALAAFGHWCQLRCGGVFEAFTQLDHSGVGSLTTSQLMKGIKGLGVFDRSGVEGALPTCGSEESFVKELLPLLDPWGHDSILAEDFFVLEPDEQLRDALRDRLERHRARNDRGGTPAGDVKAHQTAARASADSNAASRCSSRVVSRVNTPVAAPSEAGKTSVAGLSSPSRENESMKLLFQLAKHNTALGGKHWKQGPDSMAAPSERKEKVSSKEVTSRKVGRAPREPRKARAAALSASPLLSPMNELSGSPEKLSEGRPARCSSLPELGKPRPSPGEEVAAAMEAAEMAEAAAEAGLAREQCRKHKKQVKNLYGQKQFAKNVESGFLPKLPPKLSEAASAPVPLWNGGSRRRVGLVRQGRARDLFEQFEGR